MRVQFVFALVAVLAGLSGCQDASPRKPVTGTVSFGGTPITNGTIRFESDAAGPYCVEGSMIEGGRFDIPGKFGLLPGKYKVFVSMTDGKPNPNSDAGNAANPRELIPAKYNDKTTLTADVTESGPNEFTFSLEK